MSSYASQSAAVRVKVKKCEANAAPEWRKFSIDPEITTLEVLYSLLAKAFEISTDFSIKYKAYDPAGNEIYLAVLSDWDLDAAFLRIHNVAIQTATEPCLTLQIDIKPFTEVKDWDSDGQSSTSGAGDRGRGTSTGGGGGSINSANSLTPHYATGAGAARELITPLQQSFGASQKYVQHMQTKLPGLIMNQMEKTFSMVQKAFNLSEETMASLPPRAPLADHEFRLFLDALGQIQRSDELRKVIFFGGIDPSLRRVVWKHILNVYPYGMNGHQRMEYMRRKSEHYYKLRETWKAAIKQGCVIGELSYVTSMVKKDVLRTDRLHPFYAGSDDNQNIASLFNILTTYALNHPSVSYCQGMSDLASPLLVCMQDEAQAYICFCAIMARVRGNFLLDGIAMTQKFAHLTEALSFYDPEFWDYLKSQQADDLLFCYRWLLLELKREFPFEDALRMLEVQWSSLKYETSTDKELCLYEKEFVPLVETSAPTTSSSLSGSFGAPPISPSYLAVKQRENAYTKVCALRRQSSSASLSSLSSSVGGGGGAAMASASKLDNTKRLNQSLDDNMSQHAARRHRHSSSKAHQSLDESKMLMLMESANESPSAGHRNATATNNTASTTTTTELTEIEDNDDDDDVFMHNNNSNANTNTNTSAGGSNSKCEADQFDFHPTNPFKEDAQLYASKQATPTRSSACKTNRAAPAKAFLNSSTSSSLTEDDANASSAASAADDPKCNAKSPLATSPPLPSLGKGIAKLHNKNILSNYGAVSNIIAKQMAASTTAAAGSITSISSKGHFKELKEKIAATSRKGLSFDDVGGGGAGGGGAGPQVKLVKNFNEFLNFAAANKNRIADKLAATTTTTATTSTVASDATTMPPASKQSAHALVQIAKGGLSTSQDESESSSSVPETTWSCSTAATAIQQLNNLSNHSLHLELSSLSSTTAHTPEPTPTTQEANRSTTLTPDDSHDLEYYPMSTAITRELRLEAENLDRHVFGELNASGVASPTALALAAARKRPAAKASDIVYEQLDKDSLDLVDDLKENEIIAYPDVSELLVRRRARDAKVRSSIEPLQRATGGETMDGNLNVSSSSNVDVHVNHLEKSLDALKLNPFLDETFLLLDGEVPSMAGTGTLPTSSSLPEVLMPISTDASADVTAPVELATNAVDEIVYAKAPPQRRHTAVGCNGGSGEKFTGVVTGVGGGAGGDGFNTTAASNSLSNAMHGVVGGIGSTMTTMTTSGVVATLPPPMEFGGGNPFLMFLCLTLLLQHRNTIMKSAMDYNEIAMHFDKMVRKHDVTRVLNQARSMYIDYLKLQNAQNKQRQQQLNANATINTNITTTNNNNNSSSHNSDINRNNAKFATAALTATPLTTTTTGNDASATKL